LRARLLWLAFALALALPAAAAEPRGGGIAFSPCQLSHPVLPIRVPARCGTLSVAEDPASPGGRRIALRVALLSADAPRAQPDAVFVLAGGPGQSITETYPTLAGAFERLNRDRDIVLVDQRGTGGSGPLACPPEAAGHHLDVLPTDDRGRAADCARSVAADLTKYGTAAAVRDLEAVRAALGYERVNLVGFSYGTRLALAYAHEHPDRTRTLVLDGVTPFEMRVGAEFDRDAERALMALFARCLSEPPCRARFPALEHDFRDLLLRLDRRPERVRTADPWTGEPLELAVDGSALRQVVLGFLYQGETAALLPVLIEEAAGGNLAPLAAQGLLVAADLQAGLSKPVHLSVLCAEDVPFYQPPEPAARGSFLGSSARDALQALCSVWPRGEPLGPLAAPRELPVPALLISGGADPVTPPSWAELAAKSLPRSRLLTLPGQGHGNFGRGCMPRIAADFVRQGSADGLDASCLARVRPPPVFIDLLGAAP